MSTRPVECLLRWASPIFVLHWFVEPYGGQVQRKVVSCRIFWVLTSANGESATEPVAERHLPVRMDIERQLLPAGRQLGGLVVRRLSR
jgi:hypothetical protein